MERILKNETQHFDNTSSMLRLCMVITPEFVPQLFSLLSAGFTASVKAGCSIDEFLIQEFEIPKSYIDNRIQTIFLNGKAVDDSTSASLREGATLALSAAMPGMVGSTFRKKGVFASMRSQISHVAESSADDARQIEVKVRLFNLIAKELGPAFLQKGVIIEGEVFQDFALQNSEYLEAACISIFLNDEKKDVAAILKRNWEDSRVFFRVTSEKSSRM